MTPLRRSFATAVGLAAGAAIISTASPAAPALAATPAAVTSAAAPAGFAATGAGAAGRAVNLKLSGKTRAALAAAYRRSLRPSHHGKVDGPTSVYYGKITGATSAKDVYWAVGSIGIKGDPVSYQDGPHVWRKRGGGAWKYLGDTGGCLGKVPRAMLRVWHFRAGNC
ncbi:hypothetical protein [Sphaerisporangium dianthi]|uniref:Secreted protein n=1 Tax=Sphaerisporangium dianthi TaxID=1436120 RepID=A0ABV9CLF9_9ACTN